MIVFPFAKINLGLQVLHKRSDGFHAVRSILFPVPLHDALEAVVDDNLPAGTVFLDRTGLDVPGALEEDLCMKAVRRIQARRDLPGLRMHLHKAIPTGSGLGGGSSDAAHTLILLNDLLGLAMPHAELHAIASELGSDCPFFLQRSAQLAEGRGEVLFPIHVHLSGHWLGLVNPGIHVATTEVYQGMHLVENHGILSELIQARPSTWQSAIFNDMEEFVFEKHPAIGKVKQDLMDKGATYAAMSGSGATVFGIFPEKPTDLKFPVEYGLWLYPL